MFTSSGTALANSKVWELRRGFGLWISILFVKKKKKSRIKEGLRVNTAVWPVKSSLRKSGCVKRRRNSCCGVLSTMSLRSRPLRVWRRGLLGVTSPLTKLFLQRENCRDQLASCWPEPGRFYREVWSALFREGGMPQGGFWILILTYILETQTPKTEFWDYVAHGTPRPSSCPSAVCVILFRFVF